MGRIVSPLVATAPTVVVTVAPVADHLTLATISTTVSATSNGVAATITAYAWTVSGPATIANDTTATPTITPTGGGVIGIACAATVGGIVYRSAVEETTVGEASAAGGYFVQQHGVLWAEEATLDVKTAGSVTKDGVTYTVQTANWTSLDITNGVGLVAVSSAGGDARLVRPRVESSLVSRTRRWVAVTLHDTDAKAATLAAVLNAAITRGTVLNGTLSGGTWTLSCIDTITGSFVSTDFPALAGKPVVFCVEHDSSYSIRGIYYSTAAWTGDWPAFSSLTQIKQANVTGYIQTGAEMQRDTAAEVFSLATDVDYGIQQQSSITTTWLGHRVDEAL